MPGKLSKPSLDCLYLRESELYAWNCKCTIRAASDVGVGVLFPHTRANLQRRNLLQNSHHHPIPLCPMPPMVLAHRRPPFLLPPSNHRRPRHYGLQNGFSPVSLPTTKSPDSP
ncbi:hypothetical protein RHGRI_002885 [Rhododendron griersonianum]|uniref:Uncharacterized protein n=1 Tax=Rhododendron griersonianum TaxID=479676 RepID=A0AAV6LRD1_9ERIC|nr:hypothetical protein RHGRI_002885 [Rhododendron griersonianum]